MPQDLCARSAVELAGLIRAGRLSARSLMEACLARIAEREQELMAMAYMDAEAALDAAAALDRQACSPLGPLHGLPMGVKDVLDVAGAPTRYNSPIWEDNWPRADSAAVALSRRAGAVMIGKTVTAEFATRHPGPTANPHDHSRTPGGSSSGSAAGVAAGYFPLALGTQTAGSIIRPAAFCGVVGFKPTYGTIHRAGMRVVSETLDTVGVFARYVADCALLVSAITGQDLGNPDEEPGRQPRLAFTYGSAPDAADEAMAALMERAASRLATAGAQVTFIEMPSEMHAAAAVQRTVMYMEGAQGLAWELENAPQHLSEGLYESLERGRRLPFQSLVDARDLMVRARLLFPMVTEGFDAVVTPSAPGEAPHGLQSTGKPDFNLLWSVLQLPCVSVPAGKGPGSLPLGLQIVTRFGQDRDALAWAQWTRGKLGT